MNKFTIGVEEEYMVIDPVSRELTSHDQKIVEAAQSKYGDQVKAEMHQAVVEVGTKICNNTEQARKEITDLRLYVSKLAEDLGLKIGAAGTHPFSHWDKQLITDHPRYSEIINEFQEAARSNLIFGLHVHIGFQSRDLAIQIANQVRYFLPHVFAMSTNSPFWEGRNTGYKSFRTKVFDKFPRTGIPDIFNSIEDYDNYVKLLIKTNCMDSAKKIWWDLRIHPIYDTIEFRICDCPTLIDETMTFVALFQALCAKLYKLRLQNMNYINYSRALINENKWRAARYGIDGKLIDFGKEKEVECKSLLLELLDFVDDVVDDLGSRKDIEYVHTILKNGTGADRQLELFNKTQSLETVVDFITSSTLTGLN
ncbi:carboxylate-amine ligase [Pedobacter flavus]|uniref:Putative glutamate--cysteine ligase 2 n=1 Tax=Pedobacter flavus TaxID=3113906 RepID=A0ABU7H0A4_9SPHI|nr:carboxylate-amine ligase [Pedobacter sp. VNH31]MEE1884658.1 carboxylate-amine ligase [Pedobacter sp. VNH31]